MTTSSVCCNRIRLGILAAPFILGSLPGCSIFSSKPQAPSVDYDGSRGSRVLRTAMTQFGVKYKYGKAEPNKAFDCSGLIWWAYKQHGISLPRNTTGQSKIGKAISRKDARQGDIIVFKIGRRLHTGLVADKGRFLHAPSSGGYVRMEAIDGPYWKNRVVSIRRVL